MSLTAIEVKTAKPAEKPYKLTAGKGLYLLVNKSGKYWRIDYRFADKRKTLALGVYPDVSLADANEKRDTARKKLANGIDPSENKKAQKAAKQGLDATSFEVVANEWLEKFGAPVPSFPSPA